MFDAMLAPASVLTNENRAVGRTSLALLLVIGLWVGGCTPPGPRALLKGQRFVQEGRYQEAIGRLQAATKLLPQQAHAWNYLGLAYHGAGQPALAEKSYRTALDLDRKLNAARFNLGCLYLEQTNLPAAIRELTSYSLAESSSAEGWLKLGTAQLRARQWPDAERSFRSVLSLRDNDPEALNGLGVAQTQLRRPLDGLASFNAALAQQTNYGPAQWNSAVITHQYLNNRSAALPKYRQYAALHSDADDAGAVEALIRQLESDNASPLRAAVNTNPAPVSAKSELSPTGALARSSSPTANPQRQPGIASPSPKPTATNVATKSSTEQAKSSRPTSPAASPPAQVTRIQDEAPIRPAEDVPANAPPASDATPKRGFFQRINPFSNRASKSEEPKTDVAAARTDSTRSGTANRPAERYHYLSPPRPAAGDRRRAESDFKRGVRDQQKGLNAQAVAAYEVALGSDPAYFEAYYNLGLAAADVGELREALKAYEYALALRPDSTDARYNFALALKQANCPEDAAAEMEKLARNQPQDTRAHLFLANLYSQRLDQPQRAREHYLKVLELEPRHPEATRIRYWLSANP